METKRPTSPEAEEILGGYFPVLDHGFVALVDYMGSDEDVERAARVSYGYGTRSRSATRGLIRYLRRHRHTTPSEMVELKFHCCMPIFVARQWVRHRTACLAEGTEVYFDLPGGIERRGNQLYKLTIEDIWERFQPTRNRTRPDKQRNPFHRRDRVRAMHLRQMDEDTGEIQHTRIVDVYHNGKKPVFRMTLEDGKEIECTADHRFLTDEGWMTLREAFDVQERSGRAVWEATGRRLHVNGTDMEIPVWAEPDLARDEENLTTLCAECHREVTGDELRYVEELGGPPVKSEWEPKPRIPWNKLTRTRLVGVKSFEFAGTMETYDLEVEGPHHNFVANGIVTHNSLNEYSARYSLMPLLFYTPEEEDFAQQSTQNRQGRQPDASDPDVYREAVRRWRALREEAGGSYEWLLAEDVARELARIDLPASVYTQWYWKIDLHNLLHFLSLRCDPHAQFEIRRFAEIMAGMLERVAPLSYEAWVDYEFGGIHLSLSEQRALTALLETDEDAVRTRSDAAPLDEAALRDLGMSGREIREFRDKLQRRERPGFELDLSEMRPAEHFQERMQDAVPEVERA